MDENCECSLPDMDAQMTHPADHHVQAGTMAVVLEGESLTLVHVPAHVAVAPSRAHAHAAAVVKIVAADEMTLTVEARGRVDPGHAVAAKVAIGAVIEAVHEARVPRIMEKMIATVCRLKRSVQKKRKVTITLRNNGMKDVLKRKGLAPF